MKITHTLCRVTCPELAYFTRKGREVQVKAQEATAAIKAAWNAVDALMDDTLAVTIDRIVAQVHVSNVSDLDHVPGRLEISDRGAGAGNYPYEAHKTLDGVRFFTLLTQEEYEGLQCTSTTIRD